MPDATASVMTTASEYARRLRTALLVVQRHPVHQRFPSEREANRGLASGPQRRGARS